MIYNIDDWYEILDDEKSFGAKYFCFTVSCNGRSFRFVLPCRENPGKLIELCICKGKEALITVYANPYLSIEEIFNHNRIGNLSNLQFL